MNDGVAVNVQCMKSPQQLLAAATSTWLLLRLPLRLLDRMSSTVL
jgi:hypothetical protein